MTGDDTRPVKVHRIVLMVVDHDDLGAEDVAEVLEETKYPNWCIHPHVMGTETREVEWHDEHPLNRTDSLKEAFRALFADELANTQAALDLVQRDYAQVVEALGFDPIASSSASIAEAAARMRNSLRSLKTTLNLIESIGAGDRAQEDA